MAEPAKKEKPPEKNEKLQEVKPKDTGHNEATTTPKNKKIDFILLGLTLVNVLAVGTMAYFTLKLWDRIQKVREASVSIEKDEKPKHEETKLHKELQPENLGVLISLDRFLVNIPSSDGPRFLQAQLELELADNNVEEEIVRKKPAIRDAIIVLLSSRSYNELKKPEGLKSLRQDLLKSINNLLTAGRVKQIYFTQFHFN